MSASTGGHSETALPLRASVSFATIVSVFKPRIALEIMLTALAGVAVTSGSALTWQQLLALSLAVLGAAGAAGAYNQLVERDIDARMLRTRKRPFASGELTASWRWFVLVGLLLAASVMLAQIAINSMAALFVFLGAFTYGVVYTHWLKRRSTLNIVIGGLAGSFAALAGSAAVTPSLTSTAWTFAIALFLWTPPHFWSLALYNKHDYEAAHVPMLPTQVSARATALIVLCHTLLLVALTLLPSMLALGPVYGVCALAGGAYFVATSIRLLRTPTRALALRNFHASLWQLGLLLLGAIANAALQGTLIA